MLVKKWLVTLAAITTVVTCAVSVSADESYDSFDLDELIAISDSISESSEPEVSISLLTSDGEDLSWTADNKYTYSPAIITAGDKEYLEIAVVSYEGSGVKLHPCKVVSIPDDISAYIDSVSSDYEVGDLSQATVLSDKALKGHKLQRINLEGIKYIGNKALSEVSGVPSLTIPDSVEGIANEAFKSSSFSEVAFDCKVKSIPSGAFSMSRVNKVVYNKEVKGDFVIGDKAFEGANVIDLTRVLPSNANDLNLKIKYRAFYKCDSLLSLELPIHTATIGTQAFAECNDLLEVQFNDNLQYIGTGAFMGCANLMMLSDLPNSLDDDNGNKEAISAGVFSDCTKLSSIKFPIGITKVPDACFEGCTSLKSVVLGIATRAIGQGAFAGCAELNSIKNAENVNEYNDFAFAGCEALTALPSCVGKYLGNKAFYKCSSLKEVTLNFDKCGAEIFAESGVTTADLSKKVSEVPEACFKSCHSLQTVTGLANCVSIADNAFSDCERLKTLDCTVKLTKIGNSAFKNCCALTKISNSSTSVTNFGDSCFSGCKSLFVMDFSDAKFIGVEAFKGTGLTSFTVKGVSDFLEIGEKAFQNSKLTSISLSEVNSIYIHSYAFQDCEKLVKADIAIREIPEGMFYNCSALSDLKWSEPNTVSDKAFYKCKSLKKLGCDTKKISRIGQGAFSYSGLTGFTFNDDVLLTGEEQFAYCSGLVSVHSLGHLATKMFVGCESLKIAEGGYVEQAEISEDAFKGCKSLKLPVEYLESLAHSIQMLIKTVM